mgnify:FL=1|tara:strand:- start:2925 stop:3500 length:576 start_codon:yes stop_codon:yes gene_type:complete
MKKILIIAFALQFTACGIQSIPQAKNETEAKVAEINNQYKRRADLIPNLVKVVKSYAEHEKETLEAVVNARAKASSMNLNADNLNAKNLQAFNKAQSQLSGALSRLLVTVERYPELKSNQNFRDLQAQLEGSENRIAVARNRYIESVKQFNNLVTVPPTSWTNSLVYKFDKMPQWEDPNEEQNKQAPEIDL